MEDNTKYRSLKGMPDMLPDRLRLLRWVEERTRHVLGLYGYREISTPLLEETSVFTRSIGTNTDIVEKEMYSFRDRGGKDISLRPEGTASVIRAYIENHLYEDGSSVKLFYTGPMFRGERPQKGRLRQFHQIGAEVIGVSDPYVDAELVLSLDHLLKGIGVSGVTVLINSLGCPPDRKAFEKELKKFLDKEKSGLCENCRKRSAGNVLRVLDCKKEKCNNLLKGAPFINAFLCDDCRTSFDVVKEALSSHGVKYEEKPTLVRGLDYYTGTIFEVTHPGLGAQDALAAGGRYDNLSRQMGGPDAGASGYAIGLERLLLVLDPAQAVDKKGGVFIVYLDKAFKKNAFDLAMKLRETGIRCDLDYSGRSLKSQLRKVNKDNKRFAILLGENEIEQNKLLLKDMKTGVQELLTFDECEGRLKHHI